MRMKLDRSAAMDTHTKLSQMPPAQAGTPAWLEAERGIPKEVLVLGVGNDLCGDDGLGICALESLAAFSLPDWVELASAGTPGWELPLWLKGRKKVILVDALEMGLAPGEMRRFDVEAVRLLAREGYLSLHDTDLAGGLALTEALNALPDELILFGIQPAHCMPGQGLSPQVERALPALISAILDEIQSTRRSHEQTNLIDR